MCFIKFNVGVIVGGVLVVILFIGIGIFIVWKVFIIFKDRREYFVFLKLIENFIWEVVR